MQAFQVEDGFVYVRQLVADLFPQDYRAADMVHMLLSTPPTEGNFRAAMESCPRLRPYSPTGIASYLNTIIKGIAHANS